VIDAAALARAFFDGPIVNKAEQVAGTTRRDAITARDIDFLNGLMGARSPRSLWDPLVGKPQPWLRRIDPALDLIETPDRTWRGVDGSGLVRAAVAGCIGPGRNIAVATKLLHLKRPRLFPMLDRFVVELLGPGERGDADDRAAEAAHLILHLRREGRANLRPLKEIQRGLRTDGLDASLIRILDAVLWLSHPAAGMSSARARVFRCSLG
jgi:hypothetical protein